MMHNFHLLKCPNCGSSVVESHSESIKVCSYCGSKLVSKQTASAPRKKAHRSLKLLSLVAIGVLIFLAIGLFLLLDFSSSSPVSEPLKQPEMDSGNALIKSPLASIPTLNTQNMGVKKVARLLPSLSIVSQMAGKTSIGGLYWIVTVRNDSDVVVVRPKVVMSLFDADKRRIGEYTGWTKIESLDAHAETVILLLIAQPPAVSYTTEIQALAAHADNFQTMLATIKVDDFTLNSQNNNKNTITIVGDVSNPHEFRVDFIKVIAIARNKQGIAVGIADAYATQASLAGGEKSGFNIKAGTFLTKPAESWSLSASGRKHSDSN